MARAFLEKSDRTWSEGQECLVRGHFNSAANRIYYAVFQAVFGFGVKQGLLSLNEKNEKVHGIAIDIVGNFGSNGTGRFYKDQFRRLFSIRVIADYKQEDVNEVALRNLLGDADAIRKHFKRLVDK